MVGVPIATDKYVMDRATEIVRDGGADHLARCFADMPDKHAAALIAIESLAQRTSSQLRGLVWTLGCLSEHAEGLTMGCSGRAHGHSLGLLGAEEEQ